MRETPTWSTYRTSLAETTWDRASPSRVQGRSAKSIARESSLGKVSPSVGVRLRKVDVMESQAGIAARSLRLGDSRSLLLLFKSQH